jgi:hypothetical protein
VEHSRPRMCGWSVNSWRYSTQTVCTVLWKNQSSMVLRQLLTGPPFENELHHVRESVVIEYSKV